jgi:hypothetical protein
VLYPQGYIQAERVADMGDDAKPSLLAPGDGTGGNDSQYYSHGQYIQFGSPVSLRFVVPGYDRLTIEKLTMGSPYYDSMPNFYLYNHQTQKWDRQRLLFVTLTDEQCLPYIDGEGVLYARYTPNDSTGRYDSIQAPWISLKGRVE